MLIAEIYFTNSNGRYNNRGEWEAKCIFRPTILFKEAVPGLCEQACLKILRAGSLMKLITASTCQTTGGNTKSPPLTFYFWLIPYYFPSALIIWLKFIYAQS